MIGLIQRVKHANVIISGQLVADIGPGLLVFVGVENEDDEAKADQLLRRLLSYRIFSDAQDKMNLSLKDTFGELLLVPQFTLAADIKKGARPSFSSAAAPEEGERLYDYLLKKALQEYPKTSSGRFGADMQVSLLNDGPVTFWLQT